jgi:hypothetical protein
MIESMFPSLLAMDDPAAVWATLRELLERSVVSARLPFHQFSVANVAEDGTPTMRVVVLRAFDPAARTVRFHTDVRSAKVAQLRANPSVGLLFYDPPGKLQLRVPAWVTVHVGDAVARAGWEASRPDSRACYAIEPAPGTDLANAPWPTLPLHLEADAAAFANFAAVVCHFDTLEVLYLHAGGHRRARLDWTAVGLTLRRLVP